MTTQEKNLTEMGNYWRNFNFNDTTWLSHDKELEKIFAVWAEGILNAYYDCDTVMSREPITKAANNTRMLQRFMDMADECFRNPISPWRCEELYIPMLEEALKSPIAYETDKMRWRNLLETASMNRQGQTASDFEYITTKNKTGQMHNISTTWTLLYFFNPGCHDCERVSQIITESPVINALIDCGKITILAIYPDEDLSEWKKHNGQLPKTWIEARYMSQKDRDKYDLPAIPNLYLLDSNKKVIIKDGNIEEIIHLLFIS